MKEMICTCLLLIVFALWGIEWKLEKLINLINKEDEKED